MVSSLPSFELVQFQSTLPLRGATEYFARTHAGAQSISIHTPLAGSDEGHRAAHRRATHFNPHSPCGERLDGLTSTTPTDNFNPHSPCGERQAAAASPSTSFISIHTPLAGSDSYGVPRGWAVRDFNPHSPCGERRDFKIFDDAEFLFQSTLPLRGATHKIQSSRFDDVFQSTLPLRGATFRGGRSIH